MSFTQEQGLNIGKNFKNQKIIFPHITPNQKTTKCDGCDKRCEIGTFIDDDLIYPTISGRLVRYYMDACGDFHPFFGVLKCEFKTPILARIEMLQFGQKLTSLCDHYKTR